MKQHRKMNKHRRRRKPRPWTLLSAPASPRPGNCTPWCRRHVTRALDRGAFAWLDLTCAEHNGPPVHVVRPREEFDHLPLFRKYSKPRKVAA